MDLKTLYFSLFAGCSLFLYGFKELYQKGDWVLFILGLLIVAFSVSGIFKKRQN